MIRTSISLVVLAFLGACGGEVQVQMQEAGTSTCFEAARATLELCANASSEPCPGVFEGAFDRCVAERKVGQPVCYKEHGLHWYCVAVSADALLRLRDEFDGRAHGATSGVAD